MADIPFLELARIGFEVKLQRQRIASIGECLIVIMRIGRQPLRATGQVETVAVPMQNRRIRVPKRAQARSGPLAGQLNTAPADFLDRTRKHPAAERLRHQLAAQDKFPSVGNSRDSRYSIKAISDVRNG